MTSTFRSLEASETEGKFSLKIVEKPIADLPEGDLLIKYYPFYRLKGFNSTENNKKYKIPCF